MFHLVNKYGNAHKKVESERKRDELIASGYRLAEEPAEATTDVEEPAEDATDEKPKKGKAKKNDTKE